jgi:hypothetical protein
MLPLTMGRWRFTYVSHVPQPQLPTTTRLAVATSPRGSVVRLSGGGYGVPGASHPGATPDARLGRVPVAEHRIVVLDQYACDLVSHGPGRRRCGRMAGVGQGTERSRSRRRASRGHKGGCRAQLFWRLGGPKKCREHGDTPSTYAAWQNRCAPGVAGRPALYYLYNINRKTQKRKPYYILCIKIYNLLIKFMLIRWSTATLWSLRSIIPWI